MFQTTIGILRSPGLLRKRSHKRSPKPSTKNPWPSPQSASRATLPHREKLRIAVRTHSSNASARIRFELKSSATPVLRIVLHNRVVQAACCAHDGNCSIAQAVNLIQAAGLVARRHQKHIRAGFDFVRDGIVVSDFHADFRRIFLRQLAGRASHIADRRSRARRAPDFPASARLRLRRKYRSLSDPTNRETMPITGRVIFSSGSLNSSSRSFLQARLPSRLCAE